MVGGAGLEGHRPELQRVIEYQLQLRLLLLVIVRRVAVQQLVADAAEGPHVHRLGITADEPHENCINAAARHGACCVLPADAAAGTLADHADHADDGASAPRNTPRCARTTGAHARPHMDMRTGCPS